MARRKQGYALIPPSGKQTNYAIRYWSFAKKRQVKQSLGTRDASDAEIKARAIYAAALVAEPPTEVEAKDTLDFTLVAETYLAEREAKQYDDPQYLDPKTAAIYRGYYRRFAKEFPDISLFSDAGIKAYVDGRLERVLARTVKHELSALRKLVKWAAKHNLISLVIIPPVSDISDSGGSKYEHRRRSKAGYYTESEINRLINALPEFSEKRNGRARDGNGRVKFPVRARFIVSYDTGLRTTTLSLLRAPHHWAPGQKTLKLDSAVMKKRRPTEKPLTERARAALESVYNGDGPLFGSHDYRYQLTTVAVAVLGEARGRVFCAQHLRSARCTHFLEAGATLPAAAELLDHTRLSTTSIYARPSYQGLLAEMSRQEKLGRRRKAK